MRLFAIIGCIALQLLALPTVQAQSDYPNRVVRLVVGFPPGQGTDVLARFLAERLSLSMKHQVIVENRPGQGGSVALAALAKAPPDGYTIMLSSNGALVVNPHLFDTLTYDSLADFKPVGLVAELPMVIVAGKSAPFADLKGLVAYARQNPGKANFASPGTFSFLWMSILEQEAGVKFHNVPYQGSAKALPDLIAGRVDFSIDTIAAVRSHINAGDLKLLAVGPERRLTLFPDAITTAEAGYPRVQAKAWLGIVAPRGTPDDVVQRLNGEIGAALDAAMVERFQTVGAVPRTSTAAEFGALLAQEHARWKDIVQRTGAKGQ